MPQPIPQAAMLFGQNGDLIIDLPCVGCRYSLRTLRAGEQCPECGTGVDVSIERHELLSSVNWRPVRLGLLLVAIGPPAIGLIETARWAIKFWSGCSFFPGGYIGLNGILNLAMLTVAIFCLGLGPICISSGLRRLASQFGWTLSVIASGISIGVFAFHLIYQPQFSPDDLLDCVIFHTAWIACFGQMRKLIGSGKTKNRRNLFDFLPGIFLFSLFTLVLTFFLIHTSLGTYIRFIDLNLIFELTPWIVTTIVLWAYVRMVRMLRYARGRP